MNWNILVVAGGIIMSTGEGKCSNFVTIIDFNEHHLLKSKWQMGLGYKKVIYKTEAFNFVEANGSRWHCEKGISPVW